MGSLEQGSEIGAYRIDSLERVHPGGSVFRAQQPSLGRTVALHVASGPAGSEAGTRFLEQARLLASLDHPHLLPVYEVATADGVAFAVMREPGGRRLDEILRAEGALPPTRAVKLAEQLASALEALAHARASPETIPPSNVIVTEEGGGEHAYLAPLEATLEASANSEPARPSPAGSDPERSAVALAGLLTTMITGHEKVDGGPDTVRGPLQPVIARALRPEGGYASPSLLVRDASQALPQENTALRTGRRRLIGLLVAGVSVLAAALAVAVIRLTDEKASLPPSATARQDQRAGRLVASIPLGAQPKSLAVGEGSVWVATANGSVVRIDPRSNKVVGAPIRFGSPVEESNLTVRVGEGFVWALDGSAGTLTRIDPKRGRVLGRLRLGPNLEGATVANGIVWVTRSSPEGVQPPVHELLRVDAVRLRQIGKPFPIGPYPLDVEVKDGTAWVTNAGDGTITRVATRTGAVTTIRVASQPINSALHKGTLWVPDVFGNTITPVDAHEMRLPDEVIRVLHPVALAATPDAIWATAVTGEDPTSTAPAVLYRLDPQSRRIVGSPVPLGVDVGWIAAGEGAIWIPNRAKNTLLKVVPTSPPPPPRAAEPRERSPRHLLSGPLTPGKWKAKEFVAPYTLSITERGWVSLAPNREGVEIARFDDQKMTLSITAPTQVYRPDGGVRPVRSPDQILDVLSTNPNLIISPPKPTTIGGERAVRVVVRVRAHEGYPSFCAEPCVALFGLQQATIATEQSAVVRMSLLRRGKHTLVVLEKASRRAAFSRTDALIHTLRFG